MVDRIKRLMKLVLENLDKETDYDKIYMQIAKYDYLQLKLERIENVK